MTRDQLRKVIGDAVGNPAAGSVAAALDDIADAVDQAINTKPKAEKRVVEPDETR
jgi:hypothetical protein